MCFKADNDPFESPYLNLKQAAKYTGLSARTLQIKKAEGLLKYIQVGRRVLFRKEDLDEFLLLHLEGGTC